MSLRTDQRGMGIGSALMLIALAVVLALSARFVMSAVSDSNRQGSKIGEALRGEDEPNNPSDDDYIPDSPDTGSIEMDIRRVNVEINVLNVFLIASLPDHYTGTCYAVVSLPDGSELRRYTEPLERSDSCRIAVPRDKLTTGKTWQFQMSFQTFDGNYHGNHPKENFTL